MNYLTKQIIRLYEKWMSLYGVRVFYAGIEDAVVLMQAPDCMPIVFVSELDTGHALLNNAMALAFLQMRVDPTGMTTIREALQDVVADIAPQHAKQFDAIFMDFKTPPRMEDA